MKKLPYFLVIALAALVGSLATLVFVDRPAPSIADERMGLDQREAVNFNEEQKHFALTQMRGLLETLVLLDDAEATTDFDAMAAAAATQGPGLGLDHPEGFHEAMPDGFRAMSRQMRQGFGEVAAAAQSGDLDAYVRAKRQVQTTCLTCHESYRIEERE